MTAAQLRSLYPIYTGKLSLDRIKGEYRLYVRPVGALMTIGRPNIIWITYDGKTYQKAE